MAHLEKIKKDSIEEYINLMTDGPIEVILMSNYGATYKVPSNDH